MFICDHCLLPIGPKVSPIKVTLLTRPTSYVNEVPDRDDPLGFGTVEKHSTGSEIVSEENWCPQCMGLEVKPEAKPDYAMYQASANNLLKHVRGSGKVRGCNKPLDDCKTCQNNMKFFRELGLNVLSQVQNEVPARKPGFTLALLAVENCVNRASDAEKSKRAKADYAASYFFLKGYEQRGGSA